jgi:LmbE family N-acetylglucosaminyl deacetylase
MGRIQEAFAAMRGGAATPPPSEDDLLQQRRFVELARPDEEVTTIVDVRSVLDRKLAALAAHASQMRDGSWADAPREMVEQFLGWETFVRVDPPPVHGERETDLRGVV